MKFLPVQLEKRQSLHEQVYDQVRAWIISGQLAPGDRLAPTNELAALFQTHVPTVHQALARLAREGLLIRRQKAGTFVQKRAAKLTSVGIYYLPRLAARRSPYELSMRNQLEHLLTQRGVSVSHWFDPRRRDQTDTMWPELLAAARAGKIQGLIVSGAGPEHLRWLTKLSVPIALAGTADLPSAVCSDLRQLVALSLRELQRQGCRSVGSISPVPRAASGGSAPAGAPNPYLEALHEVTAQLGLELRNEWVTPAVTAVVDEQPGIEFGYEQFRRLWALPARPEGLLVYPDNVAKGVVAAVLEQGVRVPADLKLVLGKNKHVDFFCPFPATFAVHDEAEAAAALVAQVEKQFRGEICERILVRFTLSSATNPGDNRRSRKDRGHESVPKSSRSRATTNQQPKGAVHHEEF